jgi:glycosyltransferase involved in cell wall biosynthesis
LKRILFFVPCPLSRTLGVAKHAFELGDALSAYGWQATIAGPESLVGGFGRWQSETHTERCQRVAEYVRSQARSFDAVDCEHTLLPFPRDTFPPDLLLIARSFLLAHHFIRIRIPTRPGVRRWFSHQILGAHRRRLAKELAAAATKACTAADLVCVCNEDDVNELVENGIAREKTFVSALGLTPNRRIAFESMSSAAPTSPCVAFVGTFDPRKGMRDFPQIVADTISAIPDCKFKLLGTKGMLGTAEDVHAVFPRRLRGAIEVIPEFDPAALPSLLANCSVGVFPSAVEGFPFAVLEMLAASLPVVAYRAPGAPMMLPSRYLVPRGDVSGLVARLVDLLKNSVELSDARLWARRRSRDFNWDEVARSTASEYFRKLGARRASALQPQADSVGVADQ